MKDNKHKIFEHGECISEDVLLAYVNNKLNAKEKHVVEKHSLGCDMCADALEGITMMKNPSQLKGIVESLNKKIGGAGTERKPIVLWMDTRVRVAVAAGLALLIGFFFMFNDSLNDSGADKTVSDNFKQNESAADSTSLSLGEGVKIDSISNLQQTVTTGKDQDYKSDEKNLKKSGEVTFRDANGSGGPGWSATSHSTDGDALKSTNELKREESPVPPPKDEQNDVLGFNDISTVDRSKSTDDKRVLTQTEKKPDTDKKGKEDQSIVSGKVTVNSNITTNTNTTDTKTSKYYESSKPEAPKKEDKEKVVKTDDNRKSKKKSTELDESQKQPLEKSNKGEKDNAQKNSPKSTTVTGGSSGNAAPNMAPLNVSEQEVTLSNNKQQTDQEDSFTRNDTMKLFKSQLDSVSNNKYGYYGNGEISEEKKLTDNDYAGAVLVFSKTLETKPADREALYKLGDSYLHLNKPDLAIVQFDKLIAMGKGSYYDAARYDKSQALLKQKKNAEAKKLLMEIEQTSTEYKSRAKIELDKIK